MIIDRLIWEQAKEQYNVKRDSLFRKLKTEYITLCILLNLRETSAICNLNANLLSRITPGNLIYDTHSGEFVL